VPKFSKKNQKALLLLLIAIIGTFTAGAVKNPTPQDRDPAPAPISASEWYPVAKVVDGDTIDVLVGSSTVRVRLIGLDTPEVVDPRKPVQCFGKEASEKMKEIFESSPARLEIDSSQGMYDKYARLLAYVFVPDETNKPEGALVNRYMIAEGYGHEYTYDIPYKYMDDFKSAEREAREKQKGLWASGVCNGNLE
jgi:micrococcal nuclease